MTKSEPVTGETTTGVRAVLSLAPVYRLSQWLLGANGPRRFLVDDVIRPTEADRVLDMGCGTADILEHLRVDDYIGFDHSERYVQDARRRFGERAQFTADPRVLSELSDRTVVLAIGVLHHLDDDTARILLDQAKATLAPGGRFVALDPTLVDGQNRLARTLIRRDRGRYVRTPDDLRVLVSGVFPEVQVTTRSDLIRVPYTHAVTTASC